MSINLTAEEWQLLLIILFLLGIVVFGTIAMKLRKAPKTDGKIRRAVEDFERQKQDPPGDSQFIQLVAKVNAIENEQKQMRQDIKGLRIFKSTLPQEETKPDA